MREKEKKKERERYIYIYIYGTYARASTRTERTSEIDDGIGRDA